jgi:hypothetical protein
MITAKGYNGQVTFDGNFITINRKGALARMSVGKGEKRIPIASVTAVQWKPPGGLVNGFIQFSILGGNEGRSRMGRQTTDAAKDENSIIVTRKQAPEFEALRAAVDDAILERHRPQQSAVIAAPQTSRLDELKQIGELRDSGVLSTEEFESEKARIMGSGGAAPTPSPRDIDPPASWGPNAAADHDFADLQEGAESGESPGPRTEARAKAKRVGAAWATGGLSEVGRFTKKRKQDKG